LYFNYESAERQKEDDVICCLLKQLLFQMQPFPRDFDLKLGYQQSAEQNRPRPGAKHFAELLETYSKQFDTVFILLDALDECLEGERSEIFARLQRFSECGIKIFVTSRTHLLEKLECGLKAVDSDVLEIAARVDDVERFLTERLNNQTEMLDVELKDKIVRTISTGVDGQYDLTQ
jgi:hypothetical protein